MEVNEHLEVNFIQFYPAPIENNHTETNVTRRAPDYFL